MWLGAWRSSVDQPLGLTWVKKMKILGVVFGEWTEQDNWQPKLTKLEKHLNWWKSRSLSFIGKSLIINAIGLSKLTSLATVLTVPKWVVGKINDLVWSFLWGSRIQTVSRQSCFQPAVRGGLNMVVFSFKAQVLKLASIIGVCNSGCKAFFMFKYFFGSRLATFRSEWSLLRDNSSPSTIFCQRLFIPRVWRTWPAMFAKFFPVKIRLTSSFLLRNVIALFLGRGLLLLFFPGHGFHS